MRPHNIERLPYVRPRESESSPARNFETTMKLRLRNLEFAHYVTFTTMIFVVLDSLHLILHNFRFEYFYLFRHSHEVYSEIPHGVELFMIVTSLAILQSCISTSVSSATTSLYGNQCCDQASVIAASELAINV